MQSYRLLAAIPLNENDQKLVADMTATVFNPELQNSARRDGQEIQLKPCSSTGSWRWPGMQRAVNQAEVAQDVADFVDRIDQLVTAFRPHHRAAYRTGGLDPSHPRHWYRRCC